MADSSSTAQSTGAEFKPFAWNPVDGLDHEERRRASFLNDARDVIDGAHTLMQLLAWDEGRRDAAQPLLIASLGMLHAGIEGQCEALETARI
jgi:hypothetical protein